MSVIETLDKLRASSEGCSLAAFADLRTRLVLRVSSEQTWPQERLDELCTLAARSFAQADSPAVADQLLAGRSDQASEAIVLGAKEIRLFVRSELDPSDMICCVCRSVADLQILTSGARDAIRNF